VKGFTRKENFVFGTIGVVGAAMVRLLGMTMRIRWIGRETVVKLGEEPHMLAVLHGRMFLPVLKFRKRGITALASPSHDGEIVTRVVQRLGYRAVRGSTRDRAAAGLLKMIRIARENVVANMIDGPKGPREDPKIGTIAIARAAHIPIVPLIGSAAPAWEFHRAWDRFQLPKPFSRGFILVGEPFIVPEDASGDELETYRLELKQRLIEGRERVDALAWQAGMKPGLLAPLGAFWSFGSWLRGKLYDWGIKRTHRSPVPVISVGNLTAGGSGKSPLTLEIIEQVKQLNQNLRLAIVSRGYRRSTKGLRVVSDGERVLMSAAEGGDEPVMLAEKLPGTPVIVAERRAKGIRFAAETLKADIVVLDDGFQHRAASRNLDAVLLDATAPATHWRPLPDGRMREGFSALKRAGIVILNGAAPDPILEKLTAKVRSFTTAPIARGGLVPYAVRDLESGEIYIANYLMDKRLALCAGIVSPKRFYDSIESLGVKPVLLRDWPDHKSITREDVDKLMHSAKRRQADAVVITAKDAVKWPKVEKGDLPVLVLEMRWEWSEGKEQLLTALVDLIRETELE